MGHRLTPDQMVTVKAIAPFEIAEAMALWAERYKAEHDADLAAINARRRWGDYVSPYPQPVFEEKMMAMCGGLGTPWQLAAESHKSYGERVAFAIFTLLKEI